MKKVVFFIPTFRHENKDELIASLKLAVGDTGYYQVVQRIDELPVGGATIVVDSLSRLGDSADKVAVTITRILAHPGNEILVSNALDLRKSNPEFESLLQLIALFANVKRSIKAARIRESLFIKAKLNGGVVHDSGITPELKKMVIEEFQRCNAVRQTSRRLKEIGYSISPSSVSRILKDRKHE